VGTALVFSPELQRGAGGLMRAVRIIFGILCFGLGVAFAMAAVDSLVVPSTFHSVFDVTFPSMFGAMFLLGSYLLLRRPAAPGK
jgi:hypothetical protein